MKYFPTTPKTELTLADKTGQLSGFPTVYTSAKYVNLFWSYSRLRCTMSLHVNGRLTWLLFWTAELILVHNKTRACPSFQINKPAASTVSLVFWSDRVKIEDFSPLPPRTINEKKSLGGRERACPGLYNGNSINELR